jgi:hypothetical protein
MIVGAVFKPARNGIILIKVEFMRLSDISIYYLSAVSW